MSSIATGMVNKQRLVLNDLVFVIQHVCIRYFLRYHVELPQGKSGERPKS